jgi:hypothetical protein
MVLMAMSVIGLGGVIEGLVRRIVLGDDALYITDLWTRRRIPKSEIMRIYEAKGVSSMILLADGNRVSLPDLGQQLGNSIPAWLRRSS